MRSSTHAIGLEFHSDALASARIWRLPRRDADDDRVPCAVVIDHQHGRLRRPATAPRRRPADAPTTATTGVDHGPSRCGTSAAPGCRRTRPRAAYRAIRHRVRRRHDGRGFVAPLVTAALGEHAPIQVDLLGRQHGRPGRRAAASASSATGARCAGSCGRRTSSASPAPTCPATSTSRAISLPGWRSSTGLADPERGPGVTVDAATKKAIVRAALRLRLLGPPPTPPAEEARLRGAPAQPATRRRRDRAPLRRRQRLLPPRARRLDDLLVRLLAAGAGAGLRAGPRRSSPSATWSPASSGCAGHARARRRLRVGHVRPARRTHATARASSA